MEFVLNGRRISLERETVRARVSAVPPDDIRTHWVEIDGRRWPVKQAFRIAIGRTSEPFISHFAVRTFQKLGFVTSDLPGGRTQKRASERTRPVVDRSLSSDDDAMAAFRQLDAFLRDAPLTERLAGLEARMVGVGKERAPEVAAESGFTDDLVDSALVVRERVGLLDTVIHAAVITQALPLILEEGETVTRRPSLGAGNDPERVFDLETTHRVAEFKLSSWKGRDGGRKRALFADVFGLALDESGRRRQAYVVGELPVRFLTSSNGNAVKMLTKAALRLRGSDLLTPDTTVSEFTRAQGIEVIDLVGILPGLR